MQTFLIFRWMAALLAQGAALLFFSALAFSSLQSFLTAGSVLALGLVVVNTLFLILFTTRRPANSVANSPMAWALGLGCTLLPMLLRPDDASLPSHWMLIGNPLQLIGAGLVAAALLSLRRSFGVVAAHRGIQTGGLYRWIRHPLYASELLLLMGFTFAHASFWNAFVWFLVASFQILRAHLEERFLASDPVYRAYQRDCPYRFLPGVW